MEGLSIESIHIHPYLIDLRFTMYDPSDDEDDSRTASVGVRVRTGNNYGYNKPSRPASQDEGKPNNSNKKRRNIGKATRAEDIRDFVPRGGSFSAMAMMDEDSDDAASRNSDGSSGLSSTAGFKTKNRGGNNNTEKRESSGERATETSRNDQTRKRRYRVQFEDNEKSSPSRSPSVSSRGSEIHDVPHKRERPPSDDSTGDSEIEDVPIKRERPPRPPSNSTRDSEIDDVPPKRQRSPSDSTGDSEIDDVPVKRERPPRPPSNSTGDSDIDDVPPKRERRPSDSTGDSEIDDVPAKRERSPERPPVYSSTDSDSDSDDSDDNSEEEKGNDTIMLNIGSRNANNSVSEDEDDYDPESRHVIEEGLFDGGAPLSDGGVLLFDSGPALSNNAASNDGRTARTKEDAFRLASEKYPTAPVILADLDREGFEAQAKFIYYDREMYQVDPTLPISCTECLQEGHLAEVCPSKEVCSTFFFIFHMILTNVLVCTLWCLE